MGVFSYLCSMFRHFLICCFAALSVTVYGQRRLVVVDVETRVPIRGVNVISSAHLADTTDWQGLITVPDTCRTLSFSHVKYESRLLNLNEVNDTVFLISKLMGLNEVVVFGHGKSEDQLKELKKQLRMNKTEMQLAAADPSVAGSISLAGLAAFVRKLFGGRHKLTKKEKLQKMLDDY